MLALMSACACVYVRVREIEQYVANHRKQVHKNSKKMSRERSNVNSLKDKAKGDRGKLLVLVEWLKVIILQTIFRQKK